MARLEGAGGPALTRRPRLARGTIVTWMMLVLGMTLGSILVIAHGVLMDDVAQEANADVSQEIEEFRTFAAEGRDPTTGRPFVDPGRIVRLFLQRQTPGAGEVIIGYAGDSRVGRSAGPGVPPPAVHDLGKDPEFVAATRRASSGIHDTPAGPVRWGRAVVTTERGARGDGGIVVAVYTHEGRQEVVDTVRTLVALSAIGLVLAGVISWLVAGRILRPVRLVHEAAAEITEKDLTRRIDVSQDDDVVGLVTTFNLMLDRLEDAFAAQQRFVDDAGHELRTPITIVRGHLELLDDDPRARAATLRLVTQELDRMGRIVTDLLALAKSDQPDFVRAVEAVDVAQLTIAIDAKASALADRRWSISHVAEGYALIDAERITQAVLQLAQNAVQHTASDDTITLGSWLGPDAAGRWSLRFVVADTGPGIPYADRRRIFERFAHGDTPGGGRHPGAGLGLAIVRAIAEGHGGWVEVGGEPGHGATFTIVIPVEARPTGTDPAAREGAGPDPTDAHEARPSWVDRIIGRSRA